MADDVILETEGLTKEFRGFVAVKDVRLRVRRGTIHALIGPNGAGKTTCFNLLTHFLAPTRGRIRFKGREITGSRPADIARLGLVRSFQISAVFPHLSVLENVRVALQRKRGASFEGLVIEELAALAVRQLVRPELFFWRTHAGAEVDLLIVEGRRILPIEIKIGAAVDRYAIAGLRQCMKDLGLRRGWVVSTARERRRLSSGIEIIPWAEVASGQIELL